MQNSSFKHLIKELTRYLWMNVIPATPARILPNPLWQQEEKDEQTKVGNYYFQNANLNIIQNMSLQSYISHQSFPWLKKKMQFLIITINTSDQREGKSKRKMALKFKKKQPSQI